MLLSVEAFDTMTSTLGAERMLNTGETLWFAGGELEDGGGRISDGNVFPAKSSIIHSRRWFVRRNTTRVMKVRTPPEEQNVH